ncbi:hypothetical protein AGMMS49960_22420 [Betaproteobacteria bacterium]|nr:hypothetical protein AGMMS49543_03970 [Betaproteobacteria bacterium]GHU06056.1 hypothetical protein AGMMS49960_22420 [Betaproteobacteria bacterium]GHU17899.1 hypothetical protein AGMMS50243_06940 [Betaproteobacteria bacterium]GHU26832.1 hypothetical protein FACS189488_14980 [Betaproteobacteria bacterium]GHU33578.1 hypothetical protein FACS189497_15280 [Betaproteobacteria bacterium]
MSLSPTDVLEPPWYKQGWPWFLISLPAIAVIACIITFWIARETWDGLVVDDYYKEGQTIVKVLDRTHRAQELGLSALATVRDGAVRVDLAAAQAENLPASVYLTIIHPTRGGQDQEILLKGEGGVYAGPIEPLHAGRWLFQIEDEPRSWRMNGAAMLPTETEVRIQPADS